MNTKLAKPLKYIRNTFGAAAVMAAIPALTTFSALQDAKEITVEDTSIQYMDPQSSAIFVLTGKEGLRIEKGIEIGKKWDCPVYITGCNPDVKNSLTKLYKEANPETSITFGYKAQTTVENAFEIKEWLQENPNIKNLLVVTAGSHITRAWQSLKQELPEDCHVQFIPAPTDYTSPSWTELKKIAFMSICGKHHQDKEEEKYNTRHATPAACDL